MWVHQSNDKDLKVSCIIKSYNIALRSMVWFNEGIIITNWCYACTQWSPYTRESSSLLMSQSHWRDRLQTDQSYCIISNDAASVGMETVSLVWLRQKPNRRTRGARTFAQCVPWKSRHRSPAVQKDGWCSQNPQTYAKTVVFRCGFVWLAEKSVRSRRKIRVAGVTGSRTIKALR